jgi:pimeloyl-ACP methyl ester carboxylesterase
MGGIIALAMWRQAPERIVALGLCGTNPSADTLERKNSRASQLALVDSDGLQALAEQRLAPAYFSTEGPRLAGLIDTVTQMTLNAGKVRLNAQFAALSTRADSWPTLPTISVPTLVFFGADDIVCPPQDQQRMAALIPQVFVHEIAHAGHLAPLEQADTAAQLIREWLDEIDLASPEHKKQI